MKRQTLLLSASCALFLLLPSTGLATTSSLSTFEQFDGEATGDNVPGSLSNTGDINNDGYDDFLAGVPNEGSNGAVYLFYGSESTLSGTGLANADAKFTGEGASDYSGWTADSAGDVNGDGYDDFVTGTYANGNNGAAYLFYGKSAKYSNASLSTASAKWTGEASGDDAGYVVSTAGDVNKDGYSDFLVGAIGVDTAGSAAGAAYLIYGKGTNYSGTDSLSTAGAKFTGEAEDDRGGSKLTGGGDLNGDGFSDILIGAGGVSAYTGAAYLGYLYIDADGDGLAGSTGIFTGADTNDNDFDNDGSETGTDCNDSDDTVSADQTYYIDTDEDGLGDPTTTTSVCSSTAPDGYVANSDDTDDTIANNGVEIDGDGIDNDEDGEIDEVNTVAANGAHPEYGSYPANDADKATTAIKSVAAAKRGRNKVTYQDDSVYRYEVFPAYTGTKLTRIKQFRKQGRWMTLHPKGRRVALVNCMNGNIQDSEKIAKNAFAKAALKVMEIRDRWWAVSTLKDNAKVRLVIVRIKPKVNDLGKKSTAMTTAKNVIPKNTKRYKSQIRLRSKSYKVLRKYFLTKNYNLVPK